MWNDEWIWRHYMYDFAAARDVAHDHRDGYGHGNHRDTIAGREWSHDPERDQFYVHSLCKHSERGWLCDCNRHGERSIYERHLGTWRHTWLHRWSRYRHTSHNMRNHYERFWRCHVYDLSASCCYTNHHRNSHCDRNHRNTVAHCERVDHTERNPFYI